MLGDLLKGATIPLIEKKSFKGTPISVSFRNLGLKSGYISRILLRGDISVRS